MATDTGQGVWSSLGLKGPLLPQNEATSGLLRQLHETIAKLRQCQDGGQVRQEVPVPGGTLPADARLSFDTLYAAGLGEADEIDEEFMEDDSLGFEHGEHQPRVVVPPPVVEGGGHIGVSKGGVADPETRKADEAQPEQGGEPKRSKTDVELPGGGHSGVVA